jgi:hypothetical protein
MALFRRAQTPTDEETGSHGRIDAPGPSEVAGADLPPSRMRGSEALYGYVVGLELLVIAVLHLIVRTGKGAPAHPNTALQVIGVVASLAFFAVLQVRSRTIVGFAAIMTAFFVTLPKVPSSLAIANVLALAVPLAYGLILTQRQRRALGATMRGARREARARRGSAGAGSDGGRSRPSGGRDTGGRPGGRGRGKTQAAPVSGPRPSARYTPPKSRRGRAGR